MAKTDIKPRVRVSKNIKKGDRFEVKTLVSHVMETGLRKNKETGESIPRDIIRSLKVDYNGRQVLNAVWHPAMSANPYTSFYVVAQESGPMTFTWTDDDGAVYTKDIKIKVGA